MLKRPNSIDDSMASDDSTTSFDESIRNPEVLKRVLSTSKSITVLPNIAAQALEMLRDMETSIKALACLIERDAILATEVLSLANSVIYSPSKTTASLSQAIARLGFEQCRNVIICSSIRSAMQSLELEQAWIKEVLSRHGLLTGIIATNLNRHLYTGFCGEEFSAGLIHDFGRLLLASVFGSEFETVDSLDFCEDDLSLDEETSALGINHCELGAWFLGIHGIPDVLCDVIRNHHAPEKSDQHVRLCALIATADHMANHYQSFGENCEYDPSANPSIKTLALAGVENTVELFQKIAGDTITKSVKDVRALLAGKPIRTCQHTS